MRSRPSVVPRFHQFFSLMLASALVLIADRVGHTDDDDPAKGRFTLADATKGLAGAVGGSLMAKIDTTQGVFTCELFDKQAPITVANFVGLSRGLRPWKDPKTNKWVKKTFYDGLIFHRVMSGFMIQGGDPLGNGTGNPGYKFQDEFSPDLRFDRPGLLAMANAGPGTNGSQFFITGGTPQHLSGRHTIFGACEPLALVTKIGNVQKDARDKPTKDVVITKITISRGNAVKGGSQASADADRPDEANSDEQAEAPPPHPRNRSVEKDKERAKKNKVNMTVFGIPLGQTVSDEEWESMKRPGWALLVQPTEEDGILLGVTVRVIESEEFGRQLAAKYGKATKQAPLKFQNGFGATTEGMDLEWFLPGLHVRYKSDTVSVNQWSNNRQLAGSLIVETETLYRSRLAKEGAEESKKPKL